MPTNPRSRRTRIPRRLPPRPTYGTGAPVGPVAVDEAGQPRSRGAVARLERSSRQIERDTPIVMAELKRVAGVSSVCFGLLIVLAIIDHLR
jgi:hypothetical protein